jgi:adenine-specific DNA-methyltransferase
MEIARRVRPRVMRRESRLHVGPAKQQSRNLLVEGENLQAMVTLYKFRGLIDLILTDPPYNTGQSFRYNDRWDVDPNDPDLGTIVSEEDGSRHTKWIKAMMPRLQMMKAMLKPSGVCAVCIGVHDNSFRRTPDLNEAGDLFKLRWREKHAANVGLITRPRLDLALLCPDAAS